MFIFAGPSSHKEAVLIIENGNDMAKAREKSVSKSKEAILSAMRNVLFMAEHDLPNTLLSDLNSLCLQQGAEQFKDLIVDKHTSYTHNQSVQEFQAAIADTVREDLRQRLSRSDYYSILLDESTDVSVDQNLIVYVRYIFCNNVRTDFLGIRKLSDGATADKILKEITDLLFENELDVKKMCGIATDGAAVMVGSRSGLTTRFKEIVPGLLSTHCIAHRLALCSSGAYKYFSNSPKNLSRLEKIQEILASVNADSGTRLKQISNTRWLSFEGSVTALLRNYSSLITVLLEDNSPKTVGLLKSIHYSFFVRCIANTL
ncbi:zinc finger protein 862 isoform X2 [Patella vulgata]|uniref:zinc finger protein 862 isoform X2 n=1 Tax=Patella vulgata TaxID=6465 RepID=UPI00218043C7|nr:zinc finger protein 862 isoform X2 [Patella vulgata]